MKKIRVGIIGCGRIADLHILGYRDHPHAEVVSLCDTDAELLARRSAQWGVSATTTDYMELLNDPAIDAVEILTPHRQHESMVIHAAQSGKHISLQKPMTIDLPSADRMIAAVNTAGVVFRVSDNYRFYPPIVRARERITAGEIGDPLSIRIKMISGGAGGWAIPPSAWQWRLQEKAEGRGMETFDHGHHLWTTAWYLMGPVRRVNAWIDSIDSVIDSPALVMWQHEEGVRYGSCEFVHAADLTIPSDYYANDEWIDITGSKGIIQIPRCTGGIQGGAGLRVYTDGRWEEDEDVGTDWALGFIAATHNFIAAVRGEETGRLTADEAREVLAFTLAVSRSHRLGREVYLDESDHFWPWWHARRRGKQKRCATAGQGGWRQRMSFGNKEAALAPRAEELTLALVDRFDPEAAGAWEADIGLHLRDTGTDDDMVFHLSIRAGSARIERGEWPATADLVIRAPSGTWAAILMGKKRIETAFLQGRLKLDGKAELGLKLRSAFGI